MAGRARVLRHQRRGLVAQPPVARPRGPRRCDVLTGRRRWAAGAVATLALGAVAMPTASARDTHAGCTSSRRVVAHLAGGVRVAHPPRHLVVCATDTGHFTGETTIAVTKKGTVWLSAADWEWALARSNDNGAHWSAYTVPGPQAFPGCGIGTTAVTRCDTSESGKYNTVAD